MNGKVTAKKLVSKGGVVIAVIIAFIIFAIGAPSVFLTPSNIVTILKSISITTVIAMGATIGFATGVFDLSFATLATLGAAKCNLYWLVQYAYAGCHDRCNFDLYAGWRDQCCSCSKISCNGFPCNTCDAVCPGWCDSYLFWRSADQPEGCWCKWSGGCA